MAVAYGNVTNHWRAYMDYSTSTSSSAVSFTIKSGFQSQSWGFQINNVDCTISATGQSDTKVTNKPVTIAFGTTASVQLASKSFSVARQKTARTVTLKTVTYNHSGYMDGTSTVSVNVTVPAVTHTVITYNANGGSGAPANQDKYYGYQLNLSSTKPTRTGYTFLSWNTAANGSGTSWAPGADYTPDPGGTVTLYAQWQINTYTVSYDANGGTGAPASQTKTYGTDLTLSTTVPTRTGYTFEGWATSASGAVAYAAGGTYSGNAAVTLYAVWRANTWPVTYDANGGTGAPAAQTKTYGATLTLSGVRPTRDRYNFLGWATSATGAVAYQPGAQYTDNAALALYAVWEVAYIPPTLGRLSAYRCDAAGEPADDTEEVRVTCAWSVDTSIDPDNVCGTATVALRVRGTSAWSDVSTQEPGTSSGTVDVRLTGIDAETSYEVRVTVADTGGSSSAQATVGPAYYTLDFLAGGHGIAMGAPCTGDGLTVAMPSTIALGDGANGSMLSPKTNFDKVPLHKSTPYTTDGMRFDPILAGRDTAGNVWAMGEGPSQSVGMYGYLADRTDNGNDWHARIGTLDGTVSLSTPLPVDSGGTGLATSPSLLTDLGSTTAAGVMQASPRPGVTGTLPVANGGTGATGRVAAHTNLGIYTGSKVIQRVTGTDTESSQCVFTAAQFQALTGVASTASAGHFVGVANGDGSATSAHFDGCTCLSTGDWYAVFDRNVGTSSKIRVNYLIVVNT